MITRALIAICMCILPLAASSNTSDPCEYTEEERIEALREISAKIPKVKRSNWLQAFDLELTKHLPKEIANDGVYILNEKSLLLTSCISGFSQCGAIESTCKIEFSGSNAECGESICTVQ